MLAKTFSTVLLVPGLFLGWAALTFRADSAEELAQGRCADAAVGALFAAAFFADRLTPTVTRRELLRASLGAALVWAATGGPLMLTHAAAARVRFGGG